MEVVAATGVPCDFLQKQTMEKMLDLVLQSKCLSQSARNIRGSGKKPLATLAFFIFHTIEMSLK
jgi:hypothetical protein